MRYKLPAKLNIGLDRDEKALNLFRGALDPNLFETGALDLRNENALAFLKDYKFKGNEVVYCDPPYLHSTRVCDDLYRFEMSDEDHKALLEILTSLPCPVLITGYWSELYGLVLNGWNSVNYETRTRGGRTVTEWIWYNFPTPTALHDYRYLGDNFRERQRIKRKKERWIARLQKMPTVERQAMLSAIEEAW